MAATSLRDGHQPVQVILEGEQRSSERTLRYLGVVLHDYLSWRPHVEYVAAKAKQLNDVLLSLMRNHGGPRSSKRRVLAKVTNSVLQLLLDDAIDKEGKKRLQQLSFGRRNGLTPCGSYRNDGTTSLRIWNHGTTAYTGR
uniref:Uncharacterized protein n=1 Tax=Anopheles atroparvus TaxID=41427 RepID=A0A182JC82_ANOAO